MGKFIYRTLRENVVDAIRTKILNHELQPGQRIIEQDISDEFGVSRGPIREAFRQLEQEGLVEYTRNIGCSVKSVTVEDVFEVYLLRMTYEQIAARSFSGTIPSCAMQEMERVLTLMKSMDGNDFNGVIACDNLFHQAIITQTGLPRLLKAWTDLDYATVLSCSLETKDSKTVSGWQYRVHKSIYDAYCSGNTEVICHAIANHYIKTINRKIAEQNLPPESFKFPTVMMESMLSS